MAPEQPEFVMARPPEIAAHGPGAALVLAHVRFRCQRPTGDRFVEHGGQTWWRVSHADMAEEIGLPLKTVRTAVARLKCAGALLANNLPPYDNRRLAYRAQAADQPFADMGESLTCDSPVAADHSPVEANHAPLAADCAPVGASAPLYEKERKEREGADAPAPPPKLTLLINSKPTPPPMQRPPRCDRHPEGTTAPCRQCQAVREWQEAAAAEDAEARARLNRHVRAAIAACGECDDNGLVDGDNEVRRCTLHPNLDTLAAAGGTGRADTDGPSSDAHRAVQPLRHAAKPAPAQGAS